MSFPRRIRGGRVLALCAPIAVALAAPTFALAQDSASQASRRELFPAGHLTRPLIANPREPGFRLSLVHATSPGDLNALMGIAEQGGTFGIARWSLGRGETAVQLDVTGSVSAQFDLGTVHWDLLNSDYTFGFPVTIRRGATAARIRIYHLSSHLGDEFVRRDSTWVWGDPLPIPAGFRTYHQSYRFESVQLVLERQWRDWRVYGGGDYFWFVAPAQLDKRMALGGVELDRPLGGRSARGEALTGRMSLLAAVDLTMLEYRDWEREWSFRAGLDFGRRSDRARTGRRAAVLFEYHTGPAPFGQFATRTTVRYVGGGLFLTL